MKAFLFILVFVSLSLMSCGTRSAEDYHEEGQRIASELTEELRKIKTRNQLLASQQQLTRLFDALVDTIIRAREWHLRHPEARNLPLDNTLNIELQAELLRVSHLTGGLEMIEKCQEAALHRLDRFEAEMEKNTR